ncbi:organic cation transporter protein [Biomphalaria glabrata]|nr:organic cation transporter protein [Biomphalaria glabrata]
MVHISSIGHNFTNKHKHLYQLRSGFGAPFMRNIQQRTLSPRRTHLHRESIESAGPHDPGSNETISSGGRRRCVFTPQLEGHPSTEGTFEIESHWSGGVTTTCTHSTATKQQKVSVFFTSSLV